MLRIWTLILLCTCGFAAEGDVVEREQWFNGYLNQQPAMTAHQVVTRHQDGGRSTDFKTQIMIARKLMGFNSVMKVTQQRRFLEDATGVIQSFHFEDNENGKIVTATGNVDGNTVTATITRPLGSSETEIIIPKDKQLLGQVSGQRTMNEELQQIGDSFSFIGIELISGQLRLITSTATLKKIKDNGNKLFEVRIDLVPMMPVTIETDDAGELVSMRMSFGGMLSIELRAADEPLRLQPAEFAINNALQHTGGIPRHGDNHYRLKQSIIDAMEDDPFQNSNDNGVLTITNQAHQTPLAEDHPFLDKETQLEIDNPALKSWATNILKMHADKSIATQAEALRVAVRSHITTKDLSQGDASALETFASRCGDCTEHANLLCAALRINGIPARAELGFVYAPSAKSWVGHAWVSAYDQEQGRWIHLDAAYPGIQRSQYIKTVSSSGTTSTGAAMARGMSILLGQEIEVLDP